MGSGAAVAAAQGPGMVMRWYEGRQDIIRRGVPITIGDEDSGWMHDSTVEIAATDTP